tara:strand:+ start:418 stop:555 length:138 start_codon:yes stop_codon:yes gene_type:complete
MRQQHYYQANGKTQLIRGLGAVVFIKSGQLHDDTVFKYFADSRHV